MLIFKNIIAIINLFCRGILKKYCLVVACTTFVDAVAAHTGPTLYRYTNRNKTFINCFYDKKLRRVYLRKGKPAKYERVFFDLAEINAEIWW